MSINHIVLTLDITETRRRKIAYDLGQYDDDLPDDIECKDWIYQMIVDKFDGLPEANEITHLVQVISKDATNGKEEEKRN